MRRVKPSIESVYLWSSNSSAMAILNLDKGKDNSTVKREKFSILLLKQTGNFIPIELFMSFRMKLWRKGGRIGEGEGNVEKRHLGLGIDKGSLFWRKSVWKQSGYEAITEKCRGLQIRNPVSQTIGLWGTSVLWGRFNFVPCWQSCKECK